jgi:hypothetical protein
LDVPAVGPPLEVAAMGRLKEEARVVDRGVLERFSAMALQGIEALRLGEWL